MNVKIGQSYVSEVAANFAKNSADEGEDILKNLQKKYSVVKNGAASILKKFLRESLTDAEKQKKLFENLDAAEEIYKNAEKNQKIFVKIDSKGEMTIESSKTTVTFNESKRARQLAAAKTFDDVQFVMNLLQTDLSECEEGLRNNWCDEAEVEKVKKMIERAEQKISEVKRNPEKKFRRKYFACGHFDLRRNFYDNQANEPTLQRNF